MERCTSEDMVFFRLFVAYMVSFRLSKRVLHFLKVPLGGNSKTRGVGFIERASGNSGNFPTSYVRDFHSGRPAELEEVPLATDSVLLGCLGSWSGGGASK